MAGMAGEVLVELKTTGICHTDKFTLSGDDPEGLFPAILGHERAGIVREVGAGVASVAPGDHVIPLYTPERRECDYCLSRKWGLVPDMAGTASLPPARYDRKRMRLMNARDWPPPLEAEVSTEIE